ncbi:HAMP domain-containing sensor histidine kinase [Aminipila sp.]|uniref:HAMP domain-containing sensor histidine kinase n=1 Tax=Aminipila sp. TaxID=2060095 RepID=UPI001D45689B|nr:HAMP domain-containing sensor histidine kinase [Aminipila sp.]MBE6035055.1 HAMP domain-containing histidine kinase [Clostridiales bacterium]
MENVRIPKINFDKNSINFKLWAYFVLFAAFLLSLLWLLQIFFLNTYYQEMKITETNRVANVIADKYGKEDFLETIRALSVTNDMYIQIETDDAILFSPGNESGRMPVYMYLPEMNTVRKLLFEDNRRSASVIIPQKSPGHGDKKTLAYASFLEKSEDGKVILYIFSPLFPVDSTVGILRNQLFYVTIISLCMAFCLSLYLSNRISKPIRNIKKSAEKLAAGEYGVSFEGGHYTEIIQLADTLNMTSVELEKTDALRKDLIANVSHDLRTPLTMVKSYAEMIRDLSGDNPEKRKAHLDVIIEEADRLNLLVSDMLDLSRLQTHVTPLEKRRFNLSEMAQSIINTFGIYESSDGYQFILECPEEEIMVDADENKIKRVVSNLVNNAIKYCGEDKKVIVKISDINGIARCEVSDHGMGISPDEINQIWERYYKASTNHVRESKGTGLGLSIVKEIILLHNGRYGVESIEGKGSTFYFELDK